MAIGTYVRGAEAALQESGEALKVFRALQAGETTFAEGRAIATGEQAQSLFNRLYENTAATIPLGPRAQVTNFGTPVQEFQTLDRAFKWQPANSHEAEELASRLKTMMQLKPGDEVAAIRRAPPLFGFDYNKAHIVSLGVVPHDVEMPLGVSAGPAFQLESRLHAEHIHATDFLTRAVVPLSEADKWGVQLKAPTAAPPNWRRI